MKTLIVGAGPTGLTAAIELARQGIRASLVDKRAQASSLSRAVGITPASLKLLAPCGVADQLIAAGIPLTGLRVYLGDKLALSTPLISNRAYFPNLLALPQDKTETIMAGALERLGVGINYGKKLISLVHGSDGVIARFNDQSEERYDLIIGADGAHSTVRRDAQIEFSGYELDESWSIADVDAGDWRHPHEMTFVRIAAGIVMIIAPIGTNRYRLVASHPNALQAIPLPLNVSNVRREAQFRIAIRQAKRYSKGRIHLAGDAAHCHSPVGGRGMNLGIADATELARCIVEDDLPAYCASRHQEGQKLIAITERGRRFATGKHWARALAFRALLSGASLSAALRKRLGQFLVEA